MIKEIGPDLLILFKLLRWFQYPNAVLVLESYTCIILVGKVFLITFQPNFKQLTGELHYLIDIHCQFFKSIKIFPK